jgi:hypothetical protein
MLVQTGIRRYVNICFSDYHLLKYSATITLLYFDPIIHVILAFTMLLLFPWWVCCRILLTNNKSQDADIADQAHERAMEEYDHRT